MAKVLFCILSTFCFAHVHAQRISERNCFEYSKYPIIAAKPAPHMTVWLLQQDDLVLANDAALISPTFLISTLTYPESRYKSFSSRVYFAMDDWYNVSELMRDSFDIPFVLLKIARIRLDSYHRPSCLWTRGDIELESVDIFSSNITDMNGENPIILATPLSENHMQMSVTSRNLSDVEFESHKWFGKFETCVWLPDLMPGNGFGYLIQVRKPHHYLPDNYYILGFITSITIRHFELRSNSNKCLNMGYKFDGQILDWIESKVWNNNITDDNCGIIDNNVRPMILNSISTLPNEFSWHAAIYHIRKKRNRKYTCGGTLINQQTVITAAHCVVTPSGMKKAPQTLVVVLGKHDYLLTTPYSRECRVINVITHHEYDHDIYENDVALLRLGIMIQYSSYIQPICITSNKELFDNLIGVLPGWGLNEYDQVAEVLQKASFPIIPKRDCRKVGRNFSPLSPYLYDTNFCAGMANGTNLCQGDSGGGLVYNINNQWFLRGIASLGAQYTGNETGKCDPFGLSLFTDVVKICNWIQNNL